LKTDVYRREEALEAIKRSRADYKTYFGDIEEELSLATKDVIGLK